MHLFIYVFMYLYIHIIYIDKRIDIDINICLYLFIYSCPAMFCPERPEREARSKHPSFATRKHPRSTGRAAGRNDFSV